MARPAAAAGAALMSVMLSAGADADTIGPGEMPAWDGCDLPVLRLVEAAIPPQRWPGAGLEESAFLSFWRALDMGSHRSHPPVSPVPPPVSLGDALPYLGTAVAVLAMAALTRKRRHLQ